MKATSLRRAKKNANIYTMRKGQQRKMISESKRKSERLYDSAGGW